MPETTPTLLQLLSKGAATAPAIGALGRSAMSHGELRALVRNIGEDLGRHGIGANDRVAIVLPNGPVTATCFLAVAASATAAPLNPAYRDSEFEFYLSDLGAEALVVERGSDTPARDAARRLGIRVVELIEEKNGAAGEFKLVHEGAVQNRNTAPATREDAALVLHTSGTTSRPKIVPLSQANLCASAAHVCKTLALTPADHCLNVMPLFHIHGLIAAVLASLYAGGHVTCTPGFNALKFFGWLEALQPSWYTAVPTMHQAILERAERNKQIIEGSRLRLIRSSSASLPSQIMGRLEETFGCPVIESYGMTEAAHQMTSNPLPPAPRKRGSVGPPAGPEVRLMDAAGNFVARGGQGEVVIRGANVTSGYENNPDANAQAYVTDPHGGEAWFRTGDQGLFDADGYLGIIGRLKEIINRGGEKIAPREVDDVLMDHEAVAQVVTFAIPHPKLGEDIAAAVVLHPDMAASEEQIRGFARSRLADFKVPRKIIFVDEIPKGTTGKLQRIGLAEKLGLEACRT